MAVSDMRGLYLGQCTVATCNNVNTKTGKFNCYNLLLLCVDWFYKSPKMILALYCSAQGIFTRITNAPYVLDRRDGGEWGDFNCKH